MLEIADVMQALGLKRNAVYNRLEIMGPLLEEIGHLKRGANNRVLLTGEGLNLLRVLEDKHTAGETLLAAVGDIRRELGRASDSPPSEDSLVMRRLNGLETATATLSDHVRELAARVNQLELRAAPEERMLPRLIHRLFQRIDKPETGPGEDRGGPV